MNEFLWGMALSPFVVAVFYYPYLWIKKRRRKNQRVRWNLLDE